MRRLLFALLSVLLFFGCEGNSARSENDDPPVTPQCGNGTVESGELCEIKTKMTCVKLDPSFYIRGIATCLTDCSGWDTSGCTLKSIENSVCGNDVVEEGEECESGDIDYCTAIDPANYSTGTAFCKDCVWDFQNCWQKNVCGNGVVEKNIGEICEKGYAKSCLSVDPDMFIGGLAHCNSECSGWDTATCFLPNTCGNEIIEEDIGEVCEKGDSILCTVLDPENYVGGTTVCSDTCQWRYSYCDKKNVCGNHFVEKEVGEVCEWLDSISCAEISDIYASGNARCLIDCSGWDTVNCIAKGPCGNGVLDQNEECDADMTIPCVEIDPEKYSGGTSYCNDDCTGWDLSTCVE